MEPGCGWFQFDCMNRKLDMGGAYAVKAKKHMPQMQKLKTK
jgi:hypothetical protein